MTMVFRKALQSSRSICLLLMIAILAGMLFGFKPLLSLEQKAYDRMAALRHRAAGIPVIIVAIDDKSLKSIGDWPWPRSYIADIINTLSKNGARIQGVSILYRSRELNDGLTELKNFRERIHQKPPIGKKQTLNKIDRLLAETQARLNHDDRLIAAVRRARNVVLPLRFSFAEVNGHIPTDLSDWLKLNAIKVGEPFDGQNQPAQAAAFLSGRQLGKPITASQVQQPYAELSGKSGALGHTNLIVDQDMITRSIPLFVRFQNREFLSIALQIAIKYFGASIKDIRPVSTGLHLNHIHIPTVGHHQMLIDFNARETNIEKFSAVDVLEGKIPGKSFQHKIVLLGITAEEFTPTYKIPGQRHSSGIEIVANAVENIINRKHISRPAWSPTLEILVILYFGFFLLLVIPKIQPRIGMLIFVIFLATWIGVALGLFITQGYWLRIITPILFAVIGLALVERKRISDKKKDESVELKKSLGLSLQGQGLLDMALERFMKCPIEDTSVQALLYHLGLDFERKRMFNKALAVYNHILKAGAFKDIKRRIKNLEKIEHTLVLSAGQKKKDAALLFSDSAAKPTLGRYEIIKELGHGAMGTVYLGKDPSINREVAVKTLSYAEVEPQQLNEVKNQFFREAEAAGKLSHPNIVTIYDVGEDDDMAYIAMELLKGKDLTEFCSKGNLLPPDRVLSLGAAVAEALEYAHQQGVVHRDIKPANIILLENDQIKVADFGIARVMTSSTKTQTGVIFGTPNYMSPEQVAGKKVDGRSDLFSLGVVLYEMFSAEKPFKGENINALMYAITHNAYTPLSEVAPETPACCVKIIDKLLRKGVSKRYKSATQLIKQIIKCRQEMENA
ncbi:MAG: serine/threonine-protein kinase [Desulfobacterales bacterium]|jgi:serine/threonine-protein kinase